jgi:hypothetical protein
MRMGFIRAADLIDYRRAPLPSFRPDVGHTDIINLPCLSLRRVRCGTAWREKRKDGRDNKERQHVAP